MNLEKKNIIVTVILFVILYSLVQYFYGIQIELIWSSFIKSGSIITVIGLFWAFFIKKGWRWKVFRLGGWLSSIPDLNGRWEGTVCRIKNDVPHKFVLEINQTFTSLSFKAYSRNSRGESINASMIECPSGNGYKVYAFWKTYTKNPKNQSKEDSFEGASQWVISINGNDKQIEDFYFTRREPQTKGRVKVKFVSKNIKNSFE